MGHGSKKDARRANIPHSNNWNSAPPPVPQQGFWCIVHATKGCRGTSTQTAASRLLRYGAKRDMLHQTGHPPNVCARFYTVTTNNEHSAMKIVWQGQLEPMRPGILDHSQPPKKKRF